MVRQMLFWFHLSHYSILMFHSFPYHVTHPEEVTDARPKYVVNASSDVSHSKMTHEKTTKF